MGLRGDMMEASTIRAFHCFMSSAMQSGKTAVCPFVHVTSQGYLRFPLLCFSSTVSFEDYLLEGIMTCDMPIPGMVYVSPLIKLVLDGLHRIFHGL